MRGVNLDRLDLSALAVPPSLGGSGSQQQQAEDSPKKIRKPYTITKSRESWTDQEHEKFLEALQLFDRDWKKIESFVGTKTVIQIRSHAQKYFLKVQKNGTGEHVPPPRPKRKSAQPYPQKALKAGVAYPPDSPRLNVYQPAVSSTAMSAWGCPELSGWNTSYGFSTSEPGPFGTRNHSNNSCSSVVSSGGWSQDSLLHGSAGNQSLPLKGTPDFAEVYKFIGRVFDPDVGCHLKALAELTPIDRETVLLLMKNLVINISSPDFQEHANSKPRVACVLETEDTEQICEESWITSVKLLLSNSYASSTKHNPSGMIGADGLNSISCVLSQPTANGSTSISGEQGLKQSNVDDNLFQFKTGSVPVIFHAHSTDAQLRSPTHRQLSNDSEGMADIMSLPPLILESPPLPQLVNSTPWNSDKIPWESSPTRSFCTVPAIS